MMCFVLILQYFDPCGLNSTVTYLGCIHIRASKEHGSGTAVSAREDRDSSPPSAVSKFGQLHSPQHCLCFFQKRVKAIDPFYVAFLSGEANYVFVGV